MRTTFEMDPSQWPELWQAAYRILQDQIPASQLQTWLQPLQFIGTESHAQGVRVLMTSPNRFSVDWVNRNFKQQIEASFGQVLGAPCELVLSEDTPNASVNAQETDPGMNPLRPQQRSMEPTPPAPSASGTILTVENRHSLESTVDSQYTFDNFVVGASNQFAHASASAVADQPGKQYNPLFIHSPPGLGKTHLLHAIGNHVLAKNPKAKVAYLSAERFVNELIESIQRHRQAEFRRKYRDTYDLLLIDDIQFIAGKGASEEEFFHTFNTLYQSKRHIVLTSDRAPVEIEGLEERIRTRFEWGLVADIRPPEIETRIAILRAKAERDDIYLPDDVAHFLATYIKSNVRALEGILIKLHAQASLTGAEISLEMAKHELRKGLPEEGPDLTIESIQNAVIHHFKIKAQDLRSSSRAHAVSYPRQIAMYLIRKYAALGYQEIGSYFGGKDHSTIVHACRKIELGMDQDASIRDDVERIQNLL